VALHNLIVFLFDKFRIHVVEILIFDCMENFLSRHVFERVVIFSGFKVEVNFSGDAILVFELFVVKVQQSIGADESHQFTIFDSSIGVLKQFNDKMICWKFVN
jgi:hypothetical protein